MLNLLHPNSFLSKQDCSIKILQTFSSFFSFKYFPINLSKCYLWKFKTFSARRSSFRRANNKIRLRNRRICQNQCGKSLKLKKRFKKLFNFSIYFVLFLNLFYGFAPNFENVNKLLNYFWHIGIPANAVDDTFS